MAAVSSTPLLSVSPGQRQQLNAVLARLADGDRGALDLVYRLAFPAVRAAALAAALFVRTFSPRKAP